MPLGACSSVSRRGKPHTRPAQHRHLHANLLSPTPTHEDLMRGCAPARRFLFRRQALFQGRGPGSRKPAHGHVLHNVNQPDDGEQRTDHPCLLVPVVNSIPQADAREAATRHPMLLQTSALRRPSSDSGAAARPPPGGGERIRTADPLLAKQVLSQLSYTPKTGCPMPDVRRLLLGICHPSSDICPPGWWAGEDLNLRPHAYQARALTN